MFNDSNICDLASKLLQYEMALFASLPRNFNSSHFPITATITLRRQINHLLNQLTMVITPINKFLLLYNKEKIEILFKILKNVAGSSASFTVSIDNKIVMKFDNFELDGMMRNDIIADIHFSWIK